MKNRRRNLEMPKNTEENQEKMKEKLAYLGLNLNRIPKILKEFAPLSYKPVKAYEETSYKVYRYIPVCDIQILLTPAQRLTELNQKYKLAAPIGAYLDTKSEENVERFTTFLAMLKEMNEEEIEQLEEEQKKLKEMIPYEVKYTNNYIWQIFYSDVSDKYFMLVPTNEMKNNAFFYLLKKQIECSKSRKKEYIFAPITHQDYSGRYLVQSQITDIENYLWYFTKEWPNIYEVYDVKGKMTLKIVGKAKVYEDIQSDYVITLETKEKALEWYKLIKALFILATGLPNDYHFQTAISDHGELEFWQEEKAKLEYSILPTFIKEQVEQKMLLIGAEDKNIVEEQDRLQDLKKITEKQTEEYLTKQRQIATFLECKKTFFGKIKYYFGTRKKHQGSVESHQNKLELEEKERKIANQGIKEEAKEICTIEDLIEVCTKLDSRKKMIKNLQMDRKALELKKINLERKIKNANIYLNEIELHKKSIFEFWKFTNKDELPSLNEGEEEEESEKEKIGKSFVFEEDIENLGKQMDELQRRKLSKNETDAVFAVQQALTSSQILNKIKSQELKPREKKRIQAELEDLKEEYTRNVENMGVKDFDIFGGMIEDKTKVKTLHNEKHREIEKDKYKVLNITPNTELEVYIDNLRNSLKLVKEAFCKIMTPFPMPIYIAQKEKKLELDNLNVVNLNATEELYKMAERVSEGEELNFYTIQLPKDSPIIYDTNIIQFDNFNQTLPIGMNVTTKALINLGNYTLTKKKEKKIRMNYQEDEFDNKVIEVNVTEYEAIVTKKEK